MGPHRDEIAKCPSCDGGLEARGDRFVCGQCEGTLVSNASLEGMVNELAPDNQRPLAQRLVEGKQSSRNCPRCATTMKPVLLFGVEVDQCSEHGVWFDADELAKALNESGQAYAARQGPDAKTWAAVDLATGGPLKALLGWVFRNNRDPKVPPTK